MALGDLLEHHEPDIVTIADVVGTGIAEPDEEQHAYPAVLRRDAASSAKRRMMRCGPRTATETRCRMVPDQRCTAAQVRALHRIRGHGPTLLLRRGCGRGGGRAPPPGGGGGGGGAGGGGRPGARRARGAPPPPPRPPPRAPGGGGPGAEK